MQNHISIYCDKVFENLCEKNRGYMLKLQLHIRVVINRHSTGIIDIVQA